MCNFEFTKAMMCPKDIQQISDIMDRQKYYHIKYMTAKKFNPKRILEIGVRAGYSACAFLHACPNADYIGIDADNGTHGGGGGPWVWWAKQLLKKYAFNFKIHKLDSQKLEQIPKEFGTFDFIHIDGDHSYLGAYHDMEICWKALNSKGIMLIDDYDQMPKTVGNAVDDFIFNYRVSYEYQPCLRWGEVIIFKP